MQMFVFSPNIALCLALPDKLSCCVGADGPQDLPIPGAVKSEGHPANLLILDAPLAVHLPKLISW